MGAWIRTIAGLLLGLVCLPLLILLPELGVPLGIVALKLMAARFAWAARASDRLDAAWRRAKAWYQRQSATTRNLIVGGVVVLVALIVWAGVEGFA